MACYNTRIYIRTKNNKTNKKKGSMASKCNLIDSFLCCECLCWLHTLSFFFFFLSLFQDSFFDFLSPILHVIIYTFALCVMCVCVEL